MLPIVDAIQAAVLAEWCRRGTLLRLLIEAQACCSGLLPRADVCDATMHADEGAPGRMPNAAALWCCHLDRHGSQAWVLSQTM